MKPPFDFLILHGDGSRVMRLRVPRPLVYGALGLLGLVATTMAGLSGQYVFLKSQAGKLPELRAQVSAQRAFIDSFHQRVVAVRGEIDSWRQMHARMWASGVSRDVDGPYGAAHEPSGVGGPRIALAPDADASPAAADAGSPAAQLGSPAAVGEELDRLTTTVAEESPRLKDLERVVAKSARIMASLPLRWPVRGPVNSEFGRRTDPWDGAKQHHAGIDIGVPLGAQVKAPAAGIVVLAGPRGEYGNAVTLEHGNDVRSLYGHLSRVLVRSGDRVEKGQVIGLAGSTGRSTGPHLHYEVQVKGRPVNPRRFLWD